MVFEVKQAQVQVLDLLLTKLSDNECYLISPSQGCPLICKMEIGTAPILTVVKINEIMTVKHLPQSLTQELEVLFIAFPHIFLYRIQHRPRPMKSC